MGEVDKVFVQLSGRPLLVWTLAAFKKCEDIEKVVLVAARESLSRAEALVSEWRFGDVIAVVPGGETRQDSVRAGIEAAEDAEFVAIHDGARPLVTPDLISTGITLARASRAALCAIPSRDTVKEVDGEPQTVRRTLDRARMWLAQTPQVFERNLLLEAHRRAEGPATDDAALVEAMGHEVRVYEGSTANFKVTTPEDLVVAEALLRERFAP